MVSDGPAAVGGPALLAGDVEVGLHLIEGNANLTFIFFIALTLLAVLGLRFAFYAHRNDRATDLGRDGLWASLVVVGATAALFALLGLAEVVSSLRTPYRSAVLLAHILALSFAATTLCRHALPGDDGVAVPDWVWPLGAAAVLAVFVGRIAAGDSEAVTALGGLSALAFAGLGLATARRGISASRVQGTVVDTLLRHLLPVLLFASMVLVADLAMLGSLDRAVVAHVQVVFVIMTATALMTATVRLRQNLAGL